MCFRGRVKDLGLVEIVKLTEYLFDTAAQGRLDGWKQQWKENGNKVGQTFSSPRYLNCSLDLSFGHFG